MALRRNKLNFIWMLLLLGLFACSRAPEDNSDSVPTSSAERIGATATLPLLPTATAVPSPTPEPTPIHPTLQVREQTLTEEGLLTIDSLSIPAAGWLAVYQSVDGDPGSLLGTQALPAGTISPATVKIEVRETSPSLIVRLHMDEGVSGEFEYPGVDLPFEDGASEATVSIEVDIQLPIPAIKAADQQIVAMDGLINIDSVFALEPSWLVIHSLTNETIGPAIGQIPVDGGQNESLVLAIRWHIASTELMAILYEDKERPGGFDPQADLPVLSEGIPVIAEFTVTLPPDILVYDQPIIEGKIIIERAVSNGPGWITASFDEEGHPGLIIGFALLDDGINEQVELELIETAATPLLYLNLHEDSGNDGEFDFPAGDLPVVYENELLAPSVMHTNPGNYLITMDQTLGEENEVIVSLVAADLATWLVLYTADEDNNPAEIIGQTWLPAGINRDVSVIVQPGFEEKLILAVLHQDGGTAQEFDYPGGVDIPLRRNQLLIQSPITILVPPESEQFIP